MILQGLAVGLARHLFALGQQGFQAAEAAHQVTGALPADARRAGDIVHAVSHQPQHVHHPFGGDPEELLHSGGIEQRVGFGLVKHSGAVVHQLEHVLVVGDNGCLPAIFGGLSGQSPDEVVGFETIHLQNGDPHGLAELPNHRELGGQIFRHPGPIGLVLLEGFMPEGRLFAVEDDGQVVGPVLADQLAQHGRESIDGVGGMALAVGQVADGVIGPKDVGHAIHQKQSPGRGWGRGPRGGCHRWIFLLL